MGSSILLLDAVRILVSQELSAPSRMLVCRSLFKNFGLYGERIGALHLITALTISPEGAQTHLFRLFRAEISCASLFGARIVKAVLTDADMHLKWKEDIKIMASRIQGVRLLLRTEVEKLGTEGDWSHITQQIDMFSYTGLSAMQYRELKERHHVHMLKNGPVSLSGLKESNVACVAGAIKDVAERV